MSMYSCVHVRTQLSVITMQQPRQHFHGTCSARCQTRHRNNYSCWQKGLSENTLQTNGSESTRLACNGREWVRLVPPGELRSRVTTLKPSLCSKSLLPAVRSSVQNRRKCCFVLQKCYNGPRKSRRTQYLKLGKLRLKIVQSVLIAVAPYRVQIWHCLRED
ncbi:unnamed protein product [Ixodes persulcatus]